MSTNEPPEPDCGVEVVGKGEGANFGELWGAVMHKRSPEANALLVVFNEACKRMVSFNRRNGRGAASNIRLTNSPLTARGLQIIAERLEV